MIRVGILGYGYWGPILARKIASSPSCELSAICDVSAARLAEAGLQHAGTSLITDSGSFLADPDIDAVAVATPVESHFDLALAALREGKHVLVEKPITRTPDQALRLIEESDRRNLTLMVDHTYVFSPAINAISQVVRSGELGRLLYWDTARLSLGQVRPDVNVAWDLASHDFSIFDHVLSSPPCALSATGMAPHSGARDHAAHITLHLPDGLLAHVHVSWLSPVKVRRSVIGGSKRMMVYDDQEPENKVTVHDCGIDYDSGGGEVRYRRGGTRNVALDAGDPLDRVIEHFAASVSSGRRPVADGEAGLRVVRLLQAVDCSLQASGRIVPLDAEGVVA